MANTTGGTYPPLLRLQSSHRSQSIIEGNVVEALTTRKHIVGLEWDNRYEEYVRKAGLYGVHHIGHIPTDHALVSALVERWRQETHSFHFPVGEMTVTLQDAAVLLGLRVDGEAICLPTKCNWSEVVETLLGKEVGLTTFRKRSKVAINISWLYEHFCVCPTDADEVTVQQFARAYCLFLVGSVLFTDHSGNTISAIYLPLFEDFERAGRYSWASGVLSFLYRELCLASKATRMQFGGPVMLLQMWSWERLPMGRPRSRANTEPPQLGGEDLSRRPPLGYRWSGYHEFADHVTCRELSSYRREIDGLNDGNVTWLPYANKMDLLPPVCVEDHELWTTTAPLIHFWIVEMHNPNRVARQFDRYQRFPPYLRDTVDELHKTTNGTGGDWPHKHAEHMSKWNLRRHACWKEERPYNHSQRDDYVRWLSGASLLHLTSPASAPDTKSAVEEITEIVRSVADILRSRDVVDEGEWRAFARGVVKRCRAAIRHLRLPIDMDDHLVAFLDEDNLDPATSNPTATKRARHSSR